MIKVHIGHALMAMVIVIFMTLIALGLGHTTESEALQVIFSSLGAIVLTAVVANFK